MTASPKRLSTLPSKPLSAKNLNKLETSASVFIGVIKENSFRPAAAGIISTSSPDIINSPTPTRLSDSAITSARRRWSGMTLTKDKIDSRVPARFRVIS
jgi:hypothetical protein